MAKGIDTSHGGSSDLWRKVCSAWTKYDGKKGALGHQEVLKGIHTRLRRGILPKATPH